MTVELSPLHFNRNNWKRQYFAIFLDFAQKTEYASGVASVQNFVLTKTGDSPDCCESWDL